MTPKALLSILVLLPPLSANDVERAAALYQRTEYSAALDALKSSPQARMPEAQELAGKAWYQLGDYKKAIDLFEQAERQRPADSRIQNWLGRAWGRRAETSNPLMAPGYASKARRYFEQAVKLNAGDLAAVSDLLSYYLEAPGFLGGGIDKAVALAETIRARNTAEYHCAQAQIAERRKQYDTAEAQFRKAAELAPKEAGRLIDVGKFLARRGRLAEADKAFELATKTDPKNRPVLYARAEAYIDAGRDFARARQWLEEYLKGPLTPDDPSREEARKLLARARK